MRIDAFLATFFPDDDELIHPRAFPPKDISGFAEKFTTSRAELRSDRAFQSRLLDLNRSKGIYFVINSGGDRDAEINRFNAFFAEIDDRPIAEQHTALDVAPIPPAIRVETKKSVHAYWPIVGACDIGEWGAVQIRLIAYLKSDPKIKNASRVMRLPGFNHVSIDEAGDYVYKRIIVVEFDSARRFTPDEMIEAFPAVESAAAPQTRRQPIGEIPPGAFDIRDHIHLIEEYRARGEWGHGRCPAHRGQGTTSFFVNVSTGAYGCLAGCAPAEIRLALGQPKRRRGVIVLSGGQIAAPSRPARTIELDLAVKRPASVELDLEMGVSR